MDTDPELNCVVFEVKRWWKRERLVEETATRADDGILTAWRAVQARTGARPSQVRAIYSEWSAGAEDAAFITATFPQADITYSFERPAPDGWDAALKAAAQAMGKAAAQPIVSEAQSAPKHDANLLPVLRTYEPQGVFEQTVVHQPIGADLAIFLAHVNPTSRGTVGIDYLMQRSTDDSRAGTARLFELAWRNLREELQVSGGEAEGETIIAISRAADLGASALGLPEFYEQARDWIGQAEVFVAFTDPGSLMVAAPGGAVAAKLREQVEQSDYWGAVALTPACYCLSEAGLRRVAARAPRE